MHVELAALGDPVLVPGVVAAKFGLQEGQGRSPLVTLIDHLKERNLLLLLDNCEHLLDGCRRLTSALLTDCPALTVVMTSRQRLGLPGEVAWRVPSLSVPSRLGALDEEELMRSASAQLFVARAQAINPDFKLNEKSSEAVAKICRRLDGIPLAIELAAARTQVLTTQEIEGRLDDRFRLLTKGNPLSLPRHETLRATLDWSHDLLSVDQQLLWRRLSVFRGGCGLAAAEVVCTDSALPADRVLDLVGELADSSILYVEERSGSARYRLLETIRAYGLERLDNSCEADEVKRRHRAWVLEIALRAEPEWRGANQLEWLDRTEGELDNFRAALDWSFDNGDVEAGSRIATSLWLLWTVRGYFTEGRRWLETALPQMSQSTSLKARVLNDAGFLAYSQGESEVALPLLRESLRVADESADPGAVAYSTVRLGIGLFFHRDYQEAESLLQEALRMYREKGDNVGTYLALYELAEVVCALGDYERSAALHEESLALKRLQGDKWHIAFSLFGLGLLHLRRGDTAMASRLLVDCLRLRQELRTPHDIAVTLEVLAWGAAELGRARQAACLLGAANALLSTVSTVLSPHHRPGHDRCLASIQRALTPTDFDAAFKEGSRMSEEAAIAFAEAAVEAPAGAVVAKPILSARERLVASLVAQGLSNRQIAGRLVISERTAESHVEHIRNKLGFHSRSQVAAWAVEQKL
jgi:non-specific serine/threonine protein kinase